MVVIKACLAGVVLWTAFALTYKKALRLATGWEDPTTKEFEQKRIRQFQENNKRGEVIKLTEGENYF